MKKFDVGILGYWYATNYGSAITYYALSEAIKKLGHSTILIDRPEKEKDKEGEDVFPRRFLYRHCNISPSVKWEDVRSLNELCDAFVIGSDQVWTKDAVRISRNMFFLNFVADDKRKIAYAPSFGKDTFDVDQKAEEEVGRCLRRFHKISVRESSGVNILKDMFGLKADRVLDPVFLISQDDYNAVAEESKADTVEEYILAYILDPSQDKENFIKKRESTLGIPVKIILDGRKGTFEKNRAKFSMYGDKEILPTIEAEDWVKYFRDAKYILTDSHHGLAMAIIFEKPFVCYANHARGYARFTSLLNLLQLRDRMVEDAGGATDALFKQKIDYHKVDKILNKEIERSLMWLKDGLENKNLSPKANQIEEIKPLPPVSKDFARCKMLATLLRDYGIKHIVLSSGTRHVNLVRMFEANDCFQTYPVVDERSAGFFAIGLAQTLNEPVAMCCTSGTSTSNYLSSITEAYYQKVPLIVITADRYPCFLGQEEDQTIPQIGMYSAVVKKSVSLPINDGALSEWQTRRMISEAILEATHHGKGPVHINVPIISIERGKPDERLLRLDPPMRHIRRMVAGNSSEGMWRERIGFLKRCKKILLVYGQDHQPMNAAELSLFTKFCERIQCVVVKDHSGNCNYTKALQSTPIVNLMPQKYFDEHLAPDLVITLNGRLMSNNPLTNLLRGTGKRYYHWRVSEDGEITDKYRRLSCVFECTNQYFMENLLSRIGDAHWGDEYYNEWLKAAEKYPQKTYTEYSEQYAIERVVKAIPAGSIMHLALSNISRFANRFPVEPGVRTFCNLGTNGIDGSTSTFMGCCAVSKQLCFLLVGDLSFFYDMNSLWNKKLNSNIRIALFNNSEAGLLAHLNSEAITFKHNATAEGWVKSLGFRYLSAKNSKEFNDNLPVFVSEQSDAPVFFEIFADPIL